jgi:hypothetical protein
VKKSTAVALVPNAGPARRTRSLDRRGLISGAEPALIAVRALADTATGMVENFKLPDSLDDYPALLETLPTNDRFAVAVDMLKHALNEPASTDQARALVVLLLDGLRHPAGAAAKSRVAGLMIALQSIDVLVDADDMKAEPISALVIAATVARIFRRSKRAPLPCELLQACIKTRTAVASLLDRLQEVERMTGHFRKELAYLIASAAPDYAGELDDDERIAF